MIILKVAKNQRFTLSLEDTFFEKPQGGINLNPPAVLVLIMMKISIIKNIKYCNAIHEVILNIIIFLCFYEYSWQ